LHQFWPYYIKNCRCNRVEISSTGSPWKPHLHQTRFSWSNTWHYSLLIRPESSWTICGRIPSTLGRAQAWVLQPLWGILHKACYGLGTPRLQARDKGELAWLHQVLHPTQESTLGCPRFQHHYRLHDRRAEQGSRSRHRPKKNITIREMFDLAYSMLMPSTLAMASASPVSVTIIPTLAHHGRRTASAEGSSLPTPRSTVTASKRKTIGISSTRSWGPLSSSHFPPSCWSPEAMSLPPRRDRGGHFCRRWLVARTNVRRLG
jgi:hypothetical protein